MKSFLSHGMGVNSVALHLHLLDQNIDFTAFFVNHGTDWPDTYAYLYYFQEWLKEKGHKPITVLYPDVGTTDKTEGFDKLIDYCEYKKIIPSMMFRWCTDKFKIRVMNKYYEKPCFNMLGIDWGERHRAKLNSIGGIENRFPLIEAELDRGDCKEIIERHGLELPIKSGCYICPYQKRGDWVKLRNKHPDLFCRAERLEKACNEKRLAKRRADTSLPWHALYKPIYLGGRPLKEVVDERQAKLFKRDEYPPCECML